ncbi:hypothetical protein [Macrococcus brunensis]|uniref:hypothetical protein n=1 Tax=Macrococcus brunensis TaxID=198483 RepID=UPI001EF02A53|nr:hypothetical protein [Macrococcus brunensis]ULG74658.1 hypothetical protein MGG13_02510 [Macrococcus brunensis]
MKKLFICLIVVMLSFSHSPEAVAKGGGSSSSSSSSAGSSSSARSSAAATRSAVSASRLNAVSRMNSTSRISRANVQRSQTAKSLARPHVRDFSGKSGRNHYFAASAGYQNNWLMYWMVINAHHLTAAKQRAALNKLSDDAVYTITVEHKGEDKVYAVPPDMYQKIQKGSKVRINGGKVVLINE